MSEIRFGRYCTCQNGELEKNLCVKKVSWIVG